MRMRTSVIDISECEYLPPISANENMSSTFKDVNICECVHLSSIFTNANMSAIFANAKMWECVKSVDDIHECECKHNVRCIKYEEKEIMEM
ncbi:unnamed protein product [Acanthoscelides obtectus]|uniref:Uncharacterized protein n=1 Tax=Acanthoscelides obtectus TaxID=200917 RepID=A0A9P0NVX8_ACAOB|nr:unnamed protein product [Acanthoscelides obtectus]CAK1621306.1 hypothetical protein AOBTE_LOCUS886 [Acanthoscelides obtectus]